MKRHTKNNKTKKKEFIEVQKHFENRITHYLNSQNEIKTKKEIKDKT